MDKENIYVKCKKLRQQKKGVVSYLVSKGYTKAKADKVGRALDKINSDKELEEFLGAPDEAPIVAAVENDMEWKAALKFTEKYVYNKADDKYIIYLKVANGNVVIPGHIIRGIIENYSDWYGDTASVNDICRNYKIPRNYFNEIRDALGITHDSEPVSKEELIERDIDELAEDILEKKKFQLYQKVQKRSWVDTEKAAEKWFNMMDGVFNPFQSFLQTWQPPKRRVVNRAAVKHTKKTGRSLLVGLSDIHIGAFANSKLSFRGKGTTTDSLVNAMRAYGEEIHNLVEERVHNFDECILASLGDILHSSGRGFTTKGTPLTTACIKEEQFNKAFDAIVEFIDTLLELFPKVRVKAVKGNHNDFGDYVLFKALAAYYRGDKNIAFDVFESDHGLFKVNSTLFVISHGYSAEYKGRLPASGKARESYAGNLFLSHPEELIGVASKVLLTADQHHYEMKEYAEFEHYMFPTLLSGDGHAEAAGLNCMARQSCLVIGDKGVKEVINFYA